jgi:hypothetical protein
MAKDAVATMGDFLPDDTSGRDAVHVAVFSAVSSVKLRAGQDVAIVHQGEKDIEVGPVGQTVAIVDPFLKGVVRPGERFWAYLYPRTITALSHRWSHPSLEDAATTYVTPSDKLASEQWIRDFAERVDLAYRVLMEGADNWVAIKTGSKKSSYYDEYLCFGGLLEGKSVPDEFWPHYEAVTGRAVEKDHRGSFFTCSC